MATLLVGDVHGCYDELQALLRQAAFDPAADTLWCTGDLVARGPKSLEVLRFVQSLGDSARVVLGNHDLHLLAVAAGLQAPKASDRLEAVLEAPDREPLLQWLRHQPLIQQHAEFSFLMVHAGISPLWDLSTLQQCAQAVATQLQSTEYPQLLAALYGDQPDHWSSELSTVEQWRYTVNVLTRLRFCYPDGRLALQCKQTVSTAPPPLIPWFQLALSSTQGQQVVFGHWAALMGQGTPPGFYALDTGCVWGGKLSLLRWEDQHYFFQPACSNRDGIGITLSE